ncbi:hypothetical protein EON63_14840 [archaeon]|nr:MAG: hypothetical protein EON63_14840 [archaeon]
MSSPSSSSSFILPSASPSPSLALPLSYQIFDVPPDSALRCATCIDIKQSLTQEVILTSTCLPLNPSHSSLTLYTYTLTLPNPIPGSYVLSVVMKEDQLILDSTLITVSFSIFDYFSSLPDIIYTPSPRFHNNFLLAQTEDLTLVLAPGLDSGDVSIDFDIVPKGGIMPPSLPPPCVRLLKDTSGEGSSAQSLDTLLNWTCLSMKDRNLQLKNLPLGSYRVQMQFGDQDSGVKLSKLLRLLSLSAAWPALTCPNPPWEYVSNEHHVASVEVQYDVMGVQSAIALTSICLSLQQVGLEGRTLFPQQCMPVTPSRSIVLNNMPEGTYLASLSLAYVQASAQGERSVLPCCPARDLAIQIQVRGPVAFKPTYAWQRLKVWHTVPAGAETRLPIGRYEVWVWEVVYVHVYVHMCDLCVSVCGYVYIM